MAIVVSRQAIEFAAGNVELTSQLKINVDCAAVCFV